jgi:hypothetical protein
MNTSSKLRSVIGVEKPQPIIELRRFSDQRTRGTTSFADNEGDFARINGLRHDNWLRRVSDQ